MTTDAQRKRRLLIFGGVVLAAIVIVGIVIAVSSGGSDNQAGSTASSAAAAGSSGLKAVETVHTQFDGIPQSKNTLGSPTAPASLMVFADMQCPFCAEFETQALPGIVKRYVKDGKLKIVFQPIAILGNDSVLGVRGSAAAALQNKMFNFNALLYHNQGKENSGYMTTSYLKNIADGAGLDPEKFVKDIKSPQAAQIATAAQSLATSGHVSGTPTFFASKKGQPLQQIQVSSLTDPAAFYGELDKLTG